MSTTAAAPFARRPQPWYKRAIAAFDYPQGGITTAAVIPTKVDCGPFVVTYLRPTASFGEGMGAPDPDRVNLDSSSFGIDQHGSARTYHPSIDLGASNWLYRLPRLDRTRIWPVPHEPYAVITAHWRLELVKHDIQLKPDDMKMLEDYLQHDYNSYLESEGGPNWKVREEACNGTMLNGDPLPQYRIDHILENRLQSPPATYELLSSNGLRWLRYMWEPAGIRNTLNYTTVLLPNLLLSVSFHIAQMNSAPGADWWSLFLEDCEILVKTIACQRKALPGSDFIQP